MRLGQLVIPWMVFLLLFLAVLMYIWSRAHWPDICACGDYPPDTYDRIGRRSPCADQASSSLQHLVKEGAANPVPLAVRRSGRMRSGGMSAGSQSDYNGDRPTGPIANSEA